MEYLEIFYFGKNDTTITHNNYYSYFNKALIRNNEEI